MEIFISAIILFSIIFGSYMAHQEGAYRVRKKTDKEMSTIFNVEKFENISWKLCSSWRHEEDALSTAEKLRDMDREEKKKLKNVSDVTIKKFKA
jgi:hypothetical protein